MKVRSESILLKELQSNSKIYFWRPYYLIYACIKLKLYSLYEARNTELKLRNYIYMIQNPFIWILIDSEE